MKDESIYKFLAERRSASILSEPAPSKAEQDLILNVAGTVPDHGKLMPYRFVVFEGEGRHKLAEGLVNAANENRHEPLDEKLIPKIKAKAFAAPLQVLIIFSPRSSEKIPEWEQMCSASCTGYALVLAANALGYGAVWKNFAYDTGSQLRTLMQLQDGEKVLGWVNMGKEKERETSPPRPLDKTRHALFIAH
ncbi:MAG: nitroreductase [Proteobacteria bacterium]|nr:MAG: nitroreductase [Pseudomonadota bacterium]